MKSYKQRILTVSGILGALVLAAVGLAYFTLERPAPLWAQWGYRGTGLVYIKNRRTVEKAHDANEVPVSVPYAGGVGPKALTFYTNVQVLGDVDAGEFTRLMVNMTSWVAPDQGCAACHNLADFSDDAKYTKRVARRMLQMVRHVNTDWTSHVAKTGVTCYTCHRGNLIPPKSGTRQCLLGPPRRFSATRPGRTRASQRILSG
jgi:photosynthetic reaction center cytochrome c subunit